MYRRIFTTGKDAAHQRPRMFSTDFLQRFQSVSKYPWALAGALLIWTTLREQGLFANNLVFNILFHISSYPPCRFGVIRVQNICFTVSHLFHTLASICSDNSLWHWPKDSSFNIPLSQNLTLFKGPFPLPTLFWCIQKKGLISWLFDCCCCCPLSGHAVPRPEDACGFFSWLQCFQHFQGLELVK